MLARYFLFSAGNTWLVTLEGSVLGRFKSRTEAIEAAVVMADLMKAMQHDADVMVSENNQLDLVWTHGSAATPIRPRLPSPAAIESPPPHHIHRVQRGETQP